jgi:hypothetical protein
MLLDAQNFNKQTSQAAKSKRARATSESDEDAGSQVDEPRKFKRSKKKKYKEARTEDSEDEDCGSRLEDDEPVKEASSNRKKPKRASTKEASSESSDSDTDFSRFQQKPPKKATPSKEDRPSKAAAKERAQREECETRHKIAEGRKLAWKKESEAAEVRVLHNGAVATSGQGVAIRRISTGSAEK